MPRLETYTMFEMQRAVELSRLTDTEAPMSPHPIYNARRHVAEKAGPQWAANEKLRAPQPPRYTEPEIRGMFEELVVMQFEFGTTNCDLLEINRVTPGTVHRAQKILFQHDRQVTSPRFPQILLPEASKEIAETPMFRIRAHHLEWYANLLLSDNYKGKPDELAQYYIDGLLKDQEGIQKDPSLYLPSYKWYHNDLTSNTPEGAVAHGQALKADFKQFLAMADEAPVKLLGAGRDNFCEGCQIGEHCLLRKHDVRPMGTVERDAHVLWVFVHEAIRADVDTTLQVSARTASFRDAPDEEVEDIITTAGTVRRVLTNAIIDWSDLADKIPHKEAI